MHHNILPGSERKRSQELEVTDKPTTLRALSTYTSVGGILTAIYISEVLEK